MIGQKIDQLPRLHKQRAYVIDRGDGAVTSCVGTQFVPPCHQRKLRFPTPKIPTDNLEKIILNIFYIVCIGRRLVIPFRAIHMHWNLRQKRTPGSEHVRWTRWLKFSRPLENLRCVKKISYSVVRIQILLRSLPRMKVSHGGFQTIHEQRCEYEYTPFICQCDENREKKPHLLSM